MRMKKEEFEKITTVNFNDGRLSADNKWIEAINERIKKLEDETGITELKRLRDKTKFRWKAERDRS